MKAVLRELVGMFVDDGFLAVAVLGVIAAAAVLAFAVDAEPLVVGAVLFLGVMAVLVESAFRAGRRR
jgi:hypothetical protein